MARLLYSRYWQTTQRLLPIIVLALYVMSILVTALLFSWLADQSVRYALACVVVQTVSLLLLTAGLVAGKIIETRWNDRRRRRIDQISDLMAQYSSGAESQVKLLEAASAHSSEFLEVWEASLTRLKGSCRLRVEGLLHETGLDSVLVSRLGDRDPGRVLFAISLLRKLDNPSMEATEKALAHPSDVVRMAARITLAARGSRQAQERVLRELPRLPFWQRVVLFQQIPDDSPALYEYLAGAFQTGDDTTVLAALEFVLSRQRLQPVGPASRLAGSTSIEVRIKFFRALPFLATDEDPVQLITQGLDDKDWRVRAMSARACGSLGIASLGSLMAQRFARATHPVEAGHLARALTMLDGDSWRRLKEFTVAENEVTRAIAAEVIEKHLAHIQPGVR
jgi:hypothetical protein